MTFLLFLGAGSSKPFDIPTMKEMVAEYEKLLKADDVGFKFYSDIKQSLENGYGYSRIDIETIFSVIQGIAYNITPEKMGPFAFYCLSRNKPSVTFTHDEIQQAMKLMENLKSYIKNACDSKLDQIKKTQIYNQSYHALFSLMDGNKIIFRQDHEYSMDWRAYTTNYDLIFENFWKNFQKVKDYFEAQGESEHLFFNLSKNVREAGFIKLHGSLDWARDKSNQIMKIASTGYSIYESQGEVMLYPIQQKDLYLDPWITLFQNLKDGLQDCNYWIAIGYAFNDEFISSVFKEVLLRRDKKLTIIDPDAKQIRLKFPNEIRDKITALPIKFGDKNFAHQFKDYTFGLKTMEFRIKTSRQTIGFESDPPMKTITLMEGKKVKEVGRNHYVNDTLIKIQFDNPDAEILKFKVEVEHQSPYDKNQTFRITSDSIHDVDCTIHVEDKIIRSIKTQTKIRASIGHYTSESIIISQAELFV